MRASGYAASRAGQGGLQRTHRSECVVDDEDSLLLCDETGAKRLNASPQGSCQRTCPAQPLPIACTARRAATASLQLRATSFCDGDESESRERANVCVVEEEQAKHHTTHSSVARRRFIHSRNNRKMTGSCGLAFSNSPTNLHNTQSAPQQPSDTSTHAAGIEFCLAVAVVAAATTTARPACFPPSSTQHPAECWAPRCRPAAA